MSELIPDPSDPLAPAIYSDEKGTRLAPVVRWRPASSTNDADWKPLGYLTDPDLLGTDPEETP